MESCLAENSDVRFEKDQLHAFLFVYIDVQPVLIIRLLININISRKWKETWVKINYLGSFISLFKIFEKYKDQKKKKTYAPLDLSWPKSIISFTAWMVLGLGINYWVEHRQISLSKSLNEISKRCGLISIKISTSHHPSFFFFIVKLATFERNRLFEIRGRRIFFFYIAV